MKLPNGYGTIEKLKGNRRKPYGVRISYTDNSDGIPKRKRKYIAYFADHKHALEFLTEYNSGAVVPEHTKYMDVPTFHLSYANAPLMYSRLQFYQTKLQDKKSTLYCNHYR